MKVAILSESPADDAAVKILVEGILAEAIEVHQPRLRTRGYSAAVNIIPAVFKDLHYRRTADALVVVLDADNSTVHQPEHTDPQADSGDCRWCRVDATISQVRQRVRPMEGQPEIRVAVAVPPPSIEAWYMFGSDSQCTGAGWIQSRQAGANARAEIQRLKRLAYGTDRPGLQLETERAVEHAQRLRSKLDDLERFYPGSFGVFAAAIRGWQTN